MDNLRFETSKLKIPFYCIKNEIIDDYCIFVNLTQLLYQIEHSHDFHFNNPSHESVQLCYSILSTRESPPQHFLAFYSPIFIEDSISKYPFSSLILTRFFDYKRQNDRDKKLDQILLFLSSIPSIIPIYFKLHHQFFCHLFFKYSIFFSQILPNLSNLSLKRKTGKMIETNHRYVLAFSSYWPGGHVSCCQLPSGSDSSIC